MKSFAECKEAKAQDIDVHDGMIAPRTHHFKTSSRNTSRAHQRFESKVILDSGHFFLVIRRNCLLSRMLSLWKREAAKVSSTKLLRVKFLGESAIDLVRYGTNL